MPLCQRCTILTIDEIVDNDVLFHANLGALKSSAEQGCEFCSLCWSTLQSTNRAQLDSLLRDESAWTEGKEWTPSMWLRGLHFFDRGRSGARIHVSCGKSFGVMLDGEREPDWNPLPPVVAGLEVYEYVISTAHIVDCW
jgi:hypothetical protein